ncbi:hypothetical protein GCM10023324_02200 [Streptomyces youssoufiensis]
MAGTMNEPCLPFRHALTEHLLLGTPLPTDLARHLDRCPECAREQAETDDVVRTLRRADPRADWSDDRARARQDRPARELGDRVSQAVADTAPARPARRRRVALGVAAALIVAAGALAPLVGFGDEDPPPTASVALVREGRMVSHPWGTEVPVALSGLKSGESYRLMAVNADGARAPGGSVNATSGARVSTRMTTALRKETITALVVEDEEGRVVAHVPVVPYPTPSSDPSSPA